MAPALTEPNLNGSSTKDLPNFEILPDLYGWPRENANGYRIKEQLCGAERPLRVISLGAGVSGLNLAKILPEKVKNVSLAIYEKNPEVGGTWFENRLVKRLCSCAVGQIIFTCHRYPGVACDIPSHNYQVLSGVRFGWFSCD